MAAAQQGGDEILDDFLLADDAPPDLIDERLTRRGQLGEELDVARVIVCGRSSRCRQTRPPILAAGLRKLAAGARGVKGGAWARLAQCEVGALLNGVIIAFQASDGGEVAGTSVRIP